MDQIEIHKLIDSIVESGPPPTMFLAYCETCQNVMLFELGRCPDCHEVWKPLLKYVEEQKPMTA